MSTNPVLSYLRLDHPKTRIMATIGPADYRYEQLRQMLENGASIFRFNASKIKEGRFAFSDSLNVEVADVLDDLRRLSDERRQPITTSLDLAGPKARVEELVSLHERYEHTDADVLPNRPEIGDRVYLYSDEVSWSDPHIRDSLGKTDPAAHQGIDFSCLPTENRPLQERERIASMCIDQVWRMRTTVRSFETVLDTIDLRDGKCRLAVDKNHGEWVECHVVQKARDFLFMSTQGVNPKGYVFPEILTKKDWADFRWALEQCFDVICVSFVCSPFEYFQLRKEIGNQATCDPRTSTPPLIFVKFEAAFSVEPAEAKRYLETKRLNDPTVYERAIEPRDYDKYLQLLKRYTRDPIAGLCATFDGAMVARGDLVPVSKPRIRTHS